MKPYRTMQMLPASVAALVPRAFFTAGQKPAAYSSGREMKVASVNGPFYIYDMNIVPASLRRPAGLPAARFEHWQHS